MLLILEAIFESNFSTHSHDLKSNRCCHSVLGEIKRTLTEINWLIEGDISKCFDSFNHMILINNSQLIKRDERIQDNYLSYLMYKALRARYLYQGHYFS